MVDMSTQTTALDINRPPFTALLGYQESLDLAASLDFVNETLDATDGEHQQVLVTTKNGSVVTLGSAQRGSHHVVVVSRI